MADLLVNSTEPEDNYHPDDNHSILSGNTGSKKIIIITPSENKGKLSKPNNRQVFHK